MSLQQHGSTSTSDRFSEWHDQGLVVFKTEGLTPSLHTIRRPKAQRKALEMRRSACGAATRLAVVAALCQCGEDGQAIWDELPIANDVVVESAFPVDDERWENRDAGDTQYICHGQQVYDGNRLQGLVSMPLTSMTEADHEVSARLSLGRGGAFFVRRCRDRVSDAIDTDALQAASATVRASEWDGGVRLAILESQFPGLTSRFALRISPRKGRMWFAVRDRKKTGRDNVSDRDGEVVGRTEYVVETESRTRDVVLWITLQPSMGQTRRTSRSRRSGAHRAKEIVAKRQRLW